MKTMFKPWKIPTELRGNNEKTVAALKLIDPDEQIGVIDNSIKLTKAAYPLFGKLLIRDVLKLSNSMEFEYVNTALKRAAELAVMKAINKNPELSSAWRIPSQDSLYSHGYHVRKLQLMGNNLTSELHEMALAPQPFLNNTMLLQPRNIISSNTDPFSIRVRVLGELRILNNILLPAEWNMDNLRIVRCYDFNNIARYELRCSQFLSSRALITEPKWVNTVKCTNYDGTYVGGR